MSVYRRRVMQVKHPPNQITAVYNVTSTTSATKLWDNQMFSNTSMYPFTSVVIDGEMFSIKTQYTFPTTGEHEVRFIVKKGYRGTGKRLFFQIPNLISVDFSEFRGEFTSAFGMFYANTNLECVTGLKLTNATTDTAQMFYNCKKLSSLDVSDWDMSEVTDVYEMFGYCGVSSLDADNWVLNKVTRTDSMFAYCDKLKTLKASNWGLKNVTSTKRMFYHTDSLSVLDVPNWTFEKLTNPADMFYYNKGLKTINAANWLRGNAISLYSMFQYAQVLEHIDVSNWDTSNVTDTRYMFLYCYKLKSVDLSSWDLSKSTDFTGMFTGCSVLESVTFNTEIKEGAVVSNMFNDIYTSSPKLYYYPHASFVERLLPNVPSKWQKIDITTLE